MTDIEQKAREVRESLGDFIEWDGVAICWDEEKADAAIAAALQSAVAEEREECAKIPRRIAPSAGACINEIEGAIRARGQKETA